LVGDKQKKGRRKGKGRVVDPGKGGRKGSRRGKGSRFTRSVGTVVSPPPVASENTTSTGEEADEEGDKGTKGQPVGIAVLSADPVVPEDVPGNSPKYHIDDPSNEGTDKCEAGDEGHEYRPRTVV